MENLITRPQASIRVEDAADIADESLNQQSERVNDVEDVADPTESVFLKPGDLVELL